MPLTDQQLVDLGRRLRTQFNFRLPSGQVIPAGINPGQAATINVEQQLRQSPDVPPEMDINKLTTAEQGGTVPQEVFQLTLDQLKESGRVPVFDPNLGVTARDQPGGQELADQAAKLAQQFGGPVSNEPPPGFVKPGMTVPLQSPQQPQLTAQNPQVQQIQQKIEEVQKFLNVGTQQKASDIATGKPQTFQPGTAIPVQVPQKQQNAPETATTPETTSSTPIGSFNDLFQQFGLSTQNSLENVVKTISKAYGFESINKEMENLDSKYADEVAAVNDNPWISETLRSKRIANLKEKQETRKSALIDRLKLSGDLVGKAITLYDQERDLQKDLLFKAMDIRQKELDRETRMKLKAPVSATGANYNTRLGQEIANIFSGRYGLEGAREKAINILKKEFPTVDVAKDIYNRVLDNFKVQRQTASNLDTQTMTDLIDDIRRGSTLQQLYSAYPELSPALIQSMFYNQ